MEKSKEYFLRILNNEYDLDLFQMKGISRMDRDTIKEYVYSLKKKNFTMMCDDFEETLNYDSVFVQLLKNGEITVLRTEESLQINNIPNKFRIEELFISFEDFYHFNSFNCNDYVLTTNGNSFTVVFYPLF